MKRGPWDGVFDEFADFVSKKKRQLGMKEENERRRLDKNKLRADLARKCPVVVLLEFQVRDAKTRTIKRLKVILDDAFPKVMDLPAGDENGNGEDSSADGEEENPYQPHHQRPPHPQHPPHPSHPPHQSRKLHQPFRSLLRVQATPREVPMKSKRHHVSRQGPQIISFPNLLLMGYDPH